MYFTLSMQLQDNENDEKREHEKEADDSPYSWEYRPPEYHPVVSEFQKNLGLLNKFPQVDTCVHDRIAGEQRKYWYAPAFIQIDLALFYLVSLTSSPVLIILLPFLYNCVLSQKFLKKVSGHYNNAFAGSLYLGWYTVIFYVAGFAIFFIVGRFKIEIVWCFDSPHTYREFTTSMQTEIDIPLVEGGDLQYALATSNGFQNSEKSSEDVKYMSDVYECTTKRIDDFARLTCKLEDIAPFANEVEESLYFTFNSTQIRSNELGEVRIKMLNDYGFDGLEDPARRQRMVYYERYEILKKGVGMPMDMASLMKVKLIPTQYQNNIRDFHYTENKQHLISLHPNPLMDDKPEELHFEIGFDLDRRAMRYESRSLLITITQAMSLFVGVLSLGLLYIDLMIKWRLGHW
ncbi:unnamed protein product [Moneuplotes crassus]|uniref:Uncharacterized protein n=1 Tax=Euplotes crassus TaxID=5936 RepID=A0AAD1UCW7_EUPCR|nr:unnamed protein product [Moneuplotes crassus]